MVADCVHAPDPPAGLVVENTWKLRSTATQNDDVGHETWLRLPVVPTNVGALHAVDAGSVEVMTLPASLTATQRVMSGHDTPAMPL
jgi:hypothetical protein